jgi:hypothetical protein
MEELCTLAVQKSWHVGWPLQKLRGDKRLIALFTKTAPQNTDVINMNLN